MPTFLIGEVSEVAEMASKGNGTSWEPLRELAMSEHWEGQMG